MAVAKNTAAPTEDTPLDGPEAWRFDSPRKATFTVNRIVTAHTPGINGDELVYPLLTVTDQADDKVYLLHAYPETLLAELKRVQPAVGDVITVNYLGKRKTKSNRETRVFEVDSPTETAFAWDQPNF